MLVLPAFVQFKNTFLVLLWTIMNVSGGVLIATDFLLAQLSRILIVVETKLTYVEIKNQIKHLRHRNGSRISINRYPLCSWP
jgi:hypothetical protein